MRRLGLFALALSACSVSNPLFGGGDGPPGADLSANDLAIGGGVDLAGNDLTPVGTCAMTCHAPFMCCGDQCVNPLNDPLHCGGCSPPCPDTTPFCGGGTCTAPPCSTGTICIGTTFCCGQSCCANGQLCCDVMGPGPTTGPVCFTPTASQPTCPRGCPMCQ